ncbi:MULTISPECIES: effector-associated constant component EACC1 [Streptomyces]|uniref:effector-associated constant component EACC1 n=1 Tax=Streptomyces TaxID=1883 RepID=UPI000F748BA6|nr:hypothetical protein [Streptomyces sp. WAC05292]RSS95866.1 hypothetical protein EF903_03860 [Streptomyces sp. WAC05292]
MANNTIRVRMVRGADDADVAALKAWLQREHRLEQLRNGEHLDIREQPSAPDPDSSPMGAAMDIVLVLVGAAAPKLFEEVYEQVKSGVRAWRENRRAVERGEPPEVEVTRENDGR